MKKHNWKVIILIVFLAMWILFNAETVLFKILDFLAMIPLGIHAFAGNILGFENWSKIVTFINNPITILVVALITFVILLKIAKVIHRVFLKD